MPARRRAPSGCGFQARRLCCSLLTYQRVCSSLAPRPRAWEPAAKCTTYFLTDPKGLTRVASPVGMAKNVGVQGQAENVTGLPHAAAVVLCILSLRHAGCERPDLVDGPALQCNAREV